MLLQQSLFMGCQFIALGVYLILEQYSLLSNISSYTLPTEIFHADLMGVDKYCISVSGSSYLSVHLCVSLPPAGLSRVNVVFFPARQQTCGGNPQVPQNWARPGSLSFFQILVSQSNWNPCWPLCLSIQVSQSLCECETERATTSMHSV